MSRARDECGTSLPDVMVGLAIAVVGIAVLGSFFVFQDRQLGDQTHRLSTRESLVAALELMSDDFRAAGRRAPGLDYRAVASPPGICALGPSTARLTADLDGDGRTDGPNEDVTYCICAGAAGSYLYRAYRPGPSAFVVEKVADGVTGLSFALSAAQMSVAVTAVVTSPLGVSSQTMQTTVALRNAPDSVSCATGPVCPPTPCA